MHAAAMVAAAALAGAAPIGTDLGIHWWTIDAGGGLSQGGAFTLSGTVGQPDAGGAMTGDEFELTGGFWAAPADAASCDADFNNDGVLNILDFVAFQNGFTAGDPSADCNADDALNILDFVCFQGLFRAGCR